VSVVCSQDDVADAFIVQLFDAVKSPRCYAIIAIKTSATMTRAEAD